MKFWNPSKKTNLLKFEKVKFFFIYPFIFDPEDWEKINDSFNIGLPIERLGWIPSNISQGLFENNRYCWLKLSDFEILSSKSEIEEDFILDGLNSKEENIKSNMKLSTFVRLRKSGIGTITFALRLQESNGQQINFYDLDPLFRLTPRTWIHLIHNKISSRASDNSDSANYLTQLYPNDSRIPGVTLFDFFKISLSFLEKMGIKDMNFFIDPIKNSFNLGVLNPKSKLDFLSTCTNDFKSKHIHLEDTIHPYLYVCAKLSEDLFNDVFIHENNSRDVSLFTEQKDYNKQIAAILFRIFRLKQFQDLNLDYIYKELNSTSGDNPKLIGQNIMTSVFFQVYRMAAVTFYKDNEHEIYGDLPSEMLIKSSIDMIENGRAKWYGLLCANLALDQIIYSLKSLDNLAKLEIASLYRALLPVEKLLALSHADPNILLYDGHVAFNIGETVDEKMNINSLIRCIQDKREIVGKLLDDTNSIKHFDMIYE